MQTNIHLTARELMEKWEMDPIDLYHQIKDGLPAYLNGHRIQLQWLNPLEPDFEKRLSLLRFWKRDVDLWEKGGREALDEGKRLRFPKSMDDSPEPQLDGFTSPINRLRPDPQPAKRKRKPRYYKDKKKFIGLYERFLKQDPNKSTRWFYDHRVLSKDPRKSHKLHHPNKPSKPFTYKTIREWVRLYKRNELL